MPENQDKKGDKLPVDSAKDILQSGLSHEEVWEGLAKLFLGKTVQYPESSTRT